MRVLLLLTDLLDATGGIQSFNRCLVKAFDQIGRERNWTVSVLVLNDIGNNRKSINYCSPGTTQYRAFNKSKLRFLIEAMREATIASRVIVGHVNFAPVVLGLITRNSHLKIFLTVFGIDVWSKLSSLQRLGLRKVDRIISISKSTRERMLAANTLNGTHFDIIPCALEPLYGRNTTVRSRDNLKLPQGKMILSTSRLDAREEYKRIDAVISAMPSVLKKVPDAFYVIVGDGTDRARLEKLANDVGIRDKVYFTGLVHDEMLPSYYQVCDVFALPSTREGFGIVFLEAMYYAKPCVGARAGATPEVIEDGVTGLLSDPNNVEHLASAITRLLLDDNLSMSLGNAGQKRVQHEFSLERFTNNLEAAVAIHK